MRETIPNKLEMRGITKRFPGVIALDNVSLSLRPGEVLALMGENGAGKSTLMKILGGAYAPDAGQIFIDGQPIDVRSVKESKRNGIALIHQELMLAPNVDIAGNIFLGNEPRKAGPFNVIDRRRMNDTAAALLHRVGLPLHPTTPVRTLTAGQMQMVEIAKALSAEARILIMDEPTSSLTLGESEKLFEIIDGLRRDGMSIVYISHRMDEVFRLADRITVLRDGKNAGELEKQDANHNSVVSLMVGRALEKRFPARSTRADRKSVLEVSNLLVKGAPGGVSFSAYEGEILGFAGLVGSGRTELMEALFGATPALLGSMTLHGQSFLPRHPADAIRRGVFLAPEDRKKNGLVLPMSVAENVTLPDIGNYSPVGVLKRGTEQKVAADQIRKLRIKTPTAAQKAVNLSGGNQQKIVLGKWLAMRPTILILDEPTRGIDVGAKAEIYQHMTDLAAAGITILMVSSDMEEVIGMSDRIAVMHERRLKGVLDREEATQQRIALLMTGKDVA